MRSIKVVVVLVGLMPALSLSAASANDGRCPLPSIEPIDTALQQVMLAGVSDETIRRCARP